MFSDLVGYYYYKVRIWDEDSRISQCERFLNVFVKEGCRMVEISCVQSMIATRQDCAYKMYNGEGVGCWRRH